MAKGKATQQTFPLDGFPGWARTYIQSASKAYQVPLGMVGSSVLACLAIALQGKYIVSPKDDHVEQLSLQVVLVAPSGTRKTALQKAVFAPAYEHERLLRDAAAQRNTERRKERQRLQRQLKRAEKDPSASRQAMNDIEERLDAIEMEPLPSILLDDCTPEALVIRMAENGGRIGVASAEGSLFSVLGGKYSKRSDYSILVEGYSGDTLRIDRVCRETNYVRQPHLSLCIALQPDIFSALIADPVLDTTGAIARWCMVRVNSSPQIRKYGEYTLAKEMADDYNTQMLSLFGLPILTTPITLSLTESAYALHADIYAAIETNRINASFRGANYVDTSLSRWYSKMDGLVLRLAGILHIINNINYEQSTEITANELSAAYKLAGWFEAYTINILSTSVREEVVARDLWQALLELKDENNAVQYSKLVHDYCRRAPFFLPGTKQIDSQAVMDVLNVLLQHGYIAIYDVPTSGRTGRVILLSQIAIDAEANIEYQNC